MEDRDEASLGDLLALLPAAVEGATRPAFERRLWLEAAKARALEREVARLHREEPEHSAARTRRDLELAECRSIAGGVRTEIARLGAAELAPAGTTVLRGAVLGEGAKGLAGATVRAVTPDGATVASATTDGDGGFVLSMPTPANEPPSGLIGRARKVWTKEAGEAASRSAERWPPLSMFVEVRDASGQTVYRDAESRTLRRGEVHGAMLKV